MDTFDCNNFVEKLKQERVIIPTQRQDTKFDNKIDSKQLSLNNQWAKPAFVQSKYTFSNRPLPTYDFSNSKPLKNDLSKLDSETDELNIERVKEIYNTKDVKKFICSPFLSAVSYDLSFYPKIPRDLLEPDNGWISISLGKCNLPKKYESEEITGFIQLYDQNSSTPSSEPVRFRVTKGEALFSQTISSTVNFPVLSKNPFLFCILQINKKSVKSPIPFALSVPPLFNNKGQFLQSKGFPAQWSVYSEDYDETIKNIISENDSSEKVDIEFSFNCTFSEKLEREFSYSWSETPNSNYYVSPFPTISYQSTPIILLYDFQLTMKCPFNSKYVFLKLFVTEGIDNIASPTPMPLFSGIEMGKLSENFYTTSNKPGQKEINFIDQASIFVNKEFTSNTCVVFHIYSFDDTKSSPTLIGFSAIPFFQDGNPLPFDTYKLKIFDNKKLPKEMKKLIVKSSKKKEFLQCKIRLPSAYFPPLIIKNVVNAVMSEQALLPNYKEISFDVYHRQIIPIIAKLLKLIAPNTALHLIRFLDVFDDEKEKLKRTLRSWIFNVMNPEIFGSDFVNNLCKSFKSVIKSELDNSQISQNNESNVNLRELKNLVFKQLGFTLPLILDIILVSVSTPGIEYDQDVVIDFLTSIPRVISKLISIQVKALRSKNETSNQRSSRSQHSRHRESFSNQSSLIVPEGNQLASATSPKESQNDSKLDSTLMAPIRPPRVNSSFLPENLNQPHHSVRNSQMKSSKVLSVPNQPKTFAEEIELNFRFGYLMSSLLPIFGFDKISPLVFKYIYFLGKKKKDNLVNSYISYLQFSFLMPFSYSPQLIVGLALRCKANESSEISSYIPILSQIYLILHKSLSGQNDKEESEELLKIKTEVDSINVACKFFSNLSLTIEDLPDEISRKVAFILFPLINIITSNYEGAFMKNNTHVINEFIPIILYILNSSNSTLIENYFSNLGASFQMHFMNFLKFIIGLIVEKLNSNRPVSLKSKRSIISSNQLNSNLNFFNILTQRILSFLMKAIDIIEPCINLVVNILSLLYNSYQPITNVDQFYVICELLIEKYPVNRSMIAWLLSLLSFDQPDTKCLACALLVRVFEADFKNTKTVIISSIDMMDSLTAVLLAVPIKYIPTYKSLLNCIINLTKNPKMPELEKMVNERMNAALIILNVVEEQKNSTSPPEIRCQRLMRIADQYKAFPTLRLKWLLEIVKVNKSIPDYVSAFVAQLHVCTLVETVVNQLQSTDLNGVTSIISCKPSLLPSSSNSMISIDTSDSDFNFYLQTTQPMRSSETSSFSLDPKKDFAFMPGILNETDLKIESLSKDSQTLLSDFTIELLLNSLNTAIDLGKSAQLDYSLRPIFSLQLRIYHYKGNEPAKISNVIKQLAESISKIQTKSSSAYDIPLSFFLVEYRKEGENGKIESKKQIFCVENSCFDQFISFINENNRFDGNKAASFCPNHSSENCSKPGVCIVRLQPVVSNSSNEFNHCFQKFKTIVNIENEADLNEVHLIEYKSKDFLPHYRLAADVTEEKAVKMPLFDYLNNAVDQSVDLLNHVASEFEIWYPMKPNISEGQKQDLPQGKHRMALLQQRSVSAFLVKPPIPTPKNLNPIQHSKSKFFINTPDEKYVLNDIKRISAVLRFVLKGNESAAFALGAVYKKAKSSDDSEKVEKIESMANRIFQAAVRAVSVYRRAVNEFVTKQPNESLLSMCDMMVEEFSQSFGLQKLLKNQLVDEFDPMDDGIDFEE